MYPFRWRAMSVVQHHGLAGRLDRLVSLGTRRAPVGRSAAARRARGRAAHRPSPSPPSRHGLVAGGGGHDGRGGVRRGLDRRRRQLLGCTTSSSSPSRPALAAGLVVAADAAAAVPSWPRSCCVAGRVGRGVLGLCVPRRAKGVDGRDQPSAGRPNPGTPLVSAARGRRTSSSRRPAARRTPTCGACPPAPSTPASTGSARCLSGARAPTWLVLRGPHDSSRCSIRHPTTRRAESHYRRVAQICGRSIYLHDGVQRRFRDSSGPCSRTLSGRFAPIEALTEEISRMKTTESPTP